jgi:hypothetical protein
MRYLCVVVLLILTVGCVSVGNQPLDLSVVPALKGKNVVVVKRPMPDYSTMTADVLTAGGLFGVFGALIAHDAAVRTGRAMLNENHIPDPAYAIAEALGQAMQSKYGITFAGVGSAEIDSDDIAQLAASYKPAPLALDIKTLLWDSAWYPYVYDKYRMRYRARLRLIDTANAAILAEGDCLSVPDKPDTAPTYEELLENGAARLKKEIDEAVRFCVQEYSTKYLGM